MKPTKHQNSVTRSTNSVSETDLTVTLRAYGNPDYRQYADIGPKRIARVASLSNAVSVCHNYIQEWNLGGGNWGEQSGCVFQGRTQIASISYNGRIWDMAGVEIPQNGVKTAAKHEAEGWTDYR